VAEDVSTAQHETYQRIHNSDDFRTLRGRFRTFAFAWTIAFMAWYLLYVVMSSFAVDFMSNQVVGNINVALVFGLLQFASTFLIAFLYSRYAASRLDPLAGKLQDEYERGATR
jgi:uncharacterized membrane protein (DUF485 family)